MECAERGVGCGVGCSVGRTFELGLPAEVAKVIRQEGAPARLHRLNWFYSKTRIGP